MRTARRLSALLGVAAVVLLVTWAGVLPADSHVAEVGYYTLMVACGTAACVSMMAGVQVAIHDAFRAGFLTGQAAAGEPLDPATMAVLQRDGDPLLRLVE